MNRRIQRKARALGGQALEISFAAPQVVAHRLGRMAQAGVKPSARDATEFRRMHTEKTTAFFQSWNAMALEGLRAQQNVAIALMRSWTSLKPMGARTVAGLWHAAALGIVAEGLQPVHRAATANARRLSTRRS